MLNGLKSTKTVLKFKEKPVSPKGLIQNETLRQYYSYLPKPKLNPNEKLGSLKQFDTQSCSLSTKDLKT